MSYQVLSRHEETLHAYYEVKEGNLGRLRGLRFQVFWKRQNCGDGEKICVCQIGLGEGGEG